METRMKDENTGKCRDCGKEIYWQKLRNGKPMPCDTEIVGVYAGGLKRFVLEDGRIVKGTSAKENGHGYLLGFGRIPHFDTCPKARRG